MATWRTSKQGVSGSATTFTVTEPTSAAQNDFEFCVVSQVRGATITTPSGWTNFATFNTGGLGNASFFIYYVGTPGAPMRGSSAPTLVFTGSGLNTAEWHTGAVNLGGGLVIDASATQALATGTAPDPPSATATGSADESIAFGFNWTGGTWTAPSGYTMRSVNTGGLDGAFASKTLSASGAENPGTFSAFASNDIAAATILLQLSGGGIAVPRLISRPFPYAPGSSSLGRF